MNVKIAPLGSRYLYAWIQNENLNYSDQQYSSVLWDNMLGKAVTKGIYNDYTIIPEVTLHIDLSADAQQAIEWASRKMAEEAEFKKALQDNPSLKDAYEQVQMLYFLTKEK